MKTSASWLLGLFLVIGPAATAQQPCSLLPQTSFINWAQFRFTPCHTGFNPYEVILSSSTVGNLVVDWTYTTGDAVFSSPAVVNRVAYVGSEDNNVYALNALTGAKLWSFTTQGPVYSSPAVVNGVVYVGSNDNKVYALNALTGTKLWSYSTGGYVHSSPAVSNGVVLSAPRTITFTH